jgi:hypothetical protein
VATLTLTVETEDTIRAMRAVGYSTEQFTLPAAKITADNVQRAAQARVRRATGKTADGIVVTRYTDPKTQTQGYQVQATRDWMPNLPLWIEYGTKKGDPHSHTQAAAPFFWPAVALEQSAHTERMAEAVQQGIDAVGLGMEAA